MRQSLSQKPKAQFLFYASPTDGHEADDMPDYFGKLCPDVILPFDFEEEKNEDED